MNQILSCLFLFCYFSIVNAQEHQVEPAFEDFIKYPNVRDFALSASGDEAYFSIQSPLEEVAIIATMKKRNGTWSMPEMVSFSGQFRDIEPFISPDQLRLYFASNRSLDASSSEPKDFDIWYVERESLQGDWSEAINMGAIINTEHGEFYASVANNGNMYFTSDRTEGSKGKDDIYLSRWNGTSYDDAVSLSDSINTKGYEYNAFIAPDESYLLYGAYNREGGLGSGDIYISYRNKDGSWDASQNLGDGINSKFMDYCPFLDVNTNTLYFTSRRSSMTDSKIESLEAFELEISKYENGFSRIYKVPFKLE